MQVNTTIFKNKIKGYIATMHNAYFSFFILL